MKYIVCEKPGQFLLKEKAPPQVKPGEALLKIKQVGICGTDLHAYEGNQPFFTYPRILGHELSAEVVDLDTGVSHVKLGDKVVVMPYLSCGACIACRNGKTNCCTSLKVLGVHTDGGMQEYVSWPADILLPVNDLPEIHMAITEPLAIGAHAVRRGNIQSGEQVVVVGAGPIGIGIMQFAQLRGAEVIAIDTNPDRLAFCKSFLQLDHVVNALESPLEQIQSITNGDMAPVVIDATGNKKAMEYGPEYMAHGGRYVLVGLFKGNLSFYDPFIQARETSLLCSRNATLEDFRTVLAALRTGQFPAEAYISHQTTFEEMIGQFESFLAPESKVMKAVVAL